MSTVHELYKELDRLMQLGYADLPVYVSDDQGMTNELNGFVHRFVTDKDETWRSGDILDVETGTPYIEGWAGY